MTYRVKFYERGDDGRRRLLKAVYVKCDTPDLRVPLRWSAGVLGNSLPDYLARVVEVRVELVESAVKAQVQTTKVQG